MKKVLVFGTFDGIHQGHLDFFKQAKSYGDYLIVVVARDKTVEDVKKQYPKSNEKKRLERLQKSILVNEALLGYEDNPYKIIKEIKPNVICLGYDQNLFTKDLKKEIDIIGLKIKIYRLKPYHPEKFHSSLLNKK